jgi:hypothetical protein
MKIAAAVLCIAIGIPGIAEAECYRPDLKTDNCYTRKPNGEDEHGPSTRKDGAVPPGATARCRDGTYSFSHTHSGTCSWHGGVLTWRSALR